MSEPRILFYVQHLLGIGHLARASRIADALAQTGAQVTMVTGGLPVQGFPGPEVNSVRLPPVIAANVGFSGLAHPNGDLADEAFLAERRDILLKTFHQVKPDVVILEAFPFGRRQMRFELLPLLSAIEAADPRPKLFTSVRDILQQNRKPGRDEETLDVLHRYFDRILVHGDPAFVKLEETFPLVAAISEKISYTGLVAPSVPAHSDTSFDIIVSAGGGAVGHRLIEQSLAAAKLVATDRRWCVITGPNLPEADFENFRAKAAANVEILRFRSDFPSLLCNAELSISQAGYNTVCDILVAGCRSIFIPFATGGETEQTVRALRLEAMDLGSVIAETELSEGILVAAIEAQLARAKPKSADVDLQGAENTARIVLESLGSNIPS